MNDRAEEIKKDLIKYGGWSEENADKLVKEAAEAAEAVKN